MVLCVFLQMVSKRLNLFRQKSNLNLGRAGIGRMCLKIFNYDLFLSLRKHVGNLTMKRGRCQKMRRRAGNCMNTKNPAIGGAI